MRARFGRWLVHAALGCALIGFGLAGGAAALHAAAACATVSVGIDASLANNSVAAFLGHAPGQTFVARDTLIRSLTVWRVASEDTNLIGMHLYLTETDSTGRPLTNRIVLDGPTVYNPHGDGIHPIPFHWEFDPPVALPRQGLYGFFLKMSPCVGVFDVLARDGGEDRYPDGHLWWTSRSSQCILVYVFPSNAYPLADIIFTMEFCTTNPTPARRGTWGGIKVLYR